MAVEEAIKYKNRSSWKEIVVKRGENDKYDIIKFGRKRQ